MSNKDMFETLARRMTPEMARGAAAVVRSRARPVERGAPGPQWWRRPGLGLMYQVEYRPGWEWSRDFGEFNRSMMDAEGGLDFNGPFCRVDDWVRLSADTGVDYHIMEIKWHDGICYFDTALTEWKTEVDYAGQFAEASRRLGIPFMYYYSSVFDHNPQFDDVQPSGGTVSFMGIPSNPVYDEYLRGQYAEIVERYRPDGMWIDWYWPDSATETTIEYFRANHPEVVLAFNAANILPGSHSRADYTSGEGHDLDGPYVRLVKEKSGVTAVFSSTWKWASLNRRAFAHNWELISPAGRWWQDPRMRDDHYDLVRMAAVTMACGGMHCTGVTARMDGTVHPEQVKQLGILGDWYRPRRGIFGGSAPVAYGRSTPPGITVYPESVRPVLCTRSGDFILHLLNVDGATRPIRLELKGRRWRGVERAILEPAGEELDITGGTALIRRGDVDPVDTIVRWGQV